MRASLLLALAALVLLAVAPARAESPRRIFVVATGHDASADGVAAAVEEIMRQAVRADARFSLESLRAKDAPPPAEALAEATRLVDEGKRAYDELETDAAVERLSRAVDLYLAYIDAFADKAPLHRALALLASVHHQSGESDQARRVFRLLATLAPAYTLSEKEHPPSDARLLLEVQEELAFAEPGRARLSVEEGSPAAAVWVDGVYRGSTPLALLDLEPGVHVYLLRREGYARVAGRLEVDEKERLELALRPLAGLDGLRAALREVSLDARPGEEPPFDATLARLAGAVGEPAEILVARVARDGDGARVRLARVLPDRRRVLASRSVVVEREEPDEAIARLVAELLDVEVPGNAPVVADVGALPGAGGRAGEGEATPWIVAGAAGGALVLAAAAGGAVIWVMSTSSSSTLPAGYDPHAVARRHVLGF